MKIEKRKLIIEIEKRTIDKKTGHIAFQFQIGPFKKTMGTTVGAALRRTLLSLPKAVTITSACGKFYDGNCLREDLFELSLNLQKINIKSAFFPYVGTGRIRKVGPAVITAQDLQLEDGLEIVNPYQYICSINEGYTFDILVMIASPNLNQNLSHGDPSTKFIRTRKEGLKNREKSIVSSGTTKGQIFLESLENSIANSKILKSIKSINNNSVKSEKPSLVLNNKTKVLMNEVTAGKKSNILPLGTPQKLPFDIIMVDPIYSAIQSCGFEISQTIKSSVVEYDELIKRGIAQTEEFLRFVVISRGTIEPALAINSAVNELKETLSIIDSLPHVFSSQKNSLLATRDATQKLELFKTRQNIIHSFTDQILNKLDVSNLNLPIKLELSLRRQGFVSIGNLRTIPLEFLRRIGLEKNEIKVIQQALNRLELSNDIDEELVWDLIPKTIPKL
jgi:DNA-directed RNA polymerase alpha subunit